MKGRECLNIVQLKRGDKPKYDMLVMVVVWDESFRTNIGAEQKQGKHKEQQHNINNINKRTVDKESKGRHWKGLYAHVFGIQKRTRQKKTPTPIPTSNNNNNNSGH